MRYDLTRCNNLNFRLNDGTEGFIKVSPNKDVYLYTSDECRWDILRAMPRYNMVACLTNAAESFVSNHGLEIIPRDPETYDAWKVGDKVANIKHGDVYTIIALFGSAAVLTMDAEDYTVLTTTDALTKYDKLVPTDYEKELLNAQDEKKDVCPFKEGDNVLVRDTGKFWRFDKFRRYNEGEYFPYVCFSAVYKQCIPLNEHTWQLLGTTNEYKEE